MGRWAVFLALAFAVLGAARAAPLPLSRLELPPGFAIEVFARVPNARQMALGKNTLFVGSMRAGKVYAIPLRGTRAPVVIADGLEMPVGVAFRDGDLYVSAVGRILRLRDVEAKLARPPRPEVVSDAYPDETHHGWKFIAFGPDGKLYVPVGAPCNICAPDPERYAMISRLDPATGTIEVVARGVRNSVGFDWHPQTRELWFTDNGRDWLGDEAPPDELNRLAEIGQHFGYPHCHGGNIADPQFGKTRRCAEFAPPVQNLGAHVASLGMRFYDGRQFPARYRNAVFIAEHGSWNRSEKNGYRVSVVRLQGNRAVAYEPFVNGWVQGDSAWGRPVDVLVLPDGSLLVSDDHAGAIYRVVYRGER
ncbi:L-sorbosone dehydrogenase, putative [Thiobacillus denitrificans ATCC 25259]|uniref:L-sorbosone dehydrogenase, putative n=1 Tax=Thiobacillus denitrificans (strain ATCC 25259 / T1) TaxID=292415 RepID=Q3SI54_THIDA|nr:PQQ-dependent sugar dehydrogenase [Thiobacillus denitrificans]AAZ97679.1 L-sorbosone dehydrogenase, putative [Thiobacillus denitrificans ATCC 25259]